MKKEIQLFDGEVELISFGITFGMGYMCAKTESIGMLIVSAMFIGMLVIVNLKNN